MIPKDHISVLKLYYDLESNYGLIQNGLPVLVLFFPYFVWDKSVDTPKSAILIEEF